MKEVVLVFRRFVGPICSRIKGYMYVRLMAKGMISKIFRYSTLKPVGPDRNPASASLLVLLNPFLVPCEVKGFKKLLSRHCGFEVAMTESLM